MERGGEGWRGVDSDVGLERLVHNVHLLIHTAIVSNNIPIAVSHQFIMLISIGLLTKSNGVVLTSWLKWNIQTAYLNEFTTEEYI